MPTNNANDFNNPIAISQGGTNANSMGTTDGVVYYDGSALVTTNAGTSMQLLTSNGAGNAPTWQAGGGGAASGEGWDFIESQTATTGVSLLFFTIPNSYNIFKIILSNGNNPNIYVRYSTDSGSTYVSTGYSSSISSQRYFSGGQVPFPMNTDSTQAIMTQRAGGSSFAGNNTFILYFFGVTSGANCYMVGESSVDGFMKRPFAAMNNAAAITNFRIQLNLPGGDNKFSLYGLNES